MKQLNELKGQLTKADTTARALADKRPGNATAQALRARCRAALELCDSPALKGDTPSSPQSAPAPSSQLRSPNSHT